jgi:hypothetical protein
LPCYKTAGHPDCSRGSTLLPGYCSKHTQPGFESQWPRANCFVAWPRSYLLPCTQSAQIAYMAKGMTFAMLQAATQQLLSQLYIVYNLLACKDESEQDENRTGDSRVSAGIWQESCGIWRNKCTYTRPRCRHGCFAFAGACARSLPHCRAVAMASLSRGSASAGRLPHSIRSGLHD